VPKQGDVIRSDETDVQKLERERVLLTEKIARVSDESKQTIAKLDEDAKQIAQKVSDEASAISNYHRSASRKIVETANSEEARVRESVLPLVSSLEFYFWVVVALLFGLWLVAGYSISTVSSGGLAVFSVVWVVGSLVFLFVLRRRIANLRSRPDDLNAQLKSMQEEMSEVIVALPQPKPDVSTLQNSAKTLGKALGEVTSATSDLLRTEAKLVELKEKKFKLEQLIAGFSSALDRYGFPVYEQEIQANLKKRLWAIDDENLWLESLLREYRQSLPNVPSPIIRLAYFDWLGEKKDLDQSWEVVKAPSLRFQLAMILIRNKLISAPNLSDGSASALGELLAKIMSYSLDSIKVETAEFFGRLASFKEECVCHLALFDLNIVEGREQLMSFMPRSSSSDKWRGEVLTYIANELLHVDEVCVELLIDDATGDAGKLRCWKTIIRSNNLAGLAAILARKRIPNKHSEFGAGVYQQHLVLAMANCPDDFSLVEIGANLQTIEDGILGIRGGVERVSQLYRLSLSDFSYIAAFIPRSIRTIESDLLSISAQRAQIKQKVFELLYFSAVGSDRANRLFVDTVESEADGRLLADFLVSSKFVPKSSFNQQIVPLLKTQAAFDLTGFLFLYARYEKLYRSLEAMLSFMQRKRVGQITSTLTFHEVLKLCPPDSQLAFEDQLVVVATQLLVEKVGTHELTNEQKEEFALATTSLYLFGSGDPVYKLLCQKIPFKTLASRALYRYISQADQAILSSDDPRFDTAIVEALELGSDDSHFDYFKQQLGSGKFPQRTSQLIAWQLDEIKAQLKKFRRGGFDQEVLDNCAETMRRTLYGVVGLEAVQQLLATGVLIAYSLTFSKNYSVDALLDSKNDFLDRSARALAARWETGRYDEVVKLTRGNMRVGLVPLEMSFDTLARKFHEVLRGAVKLHNAKFPNDPLPDPVSCYLSRILPSDGTLKEIISPDEVELGPLESVRTLMRGNMSGEECLVLLAIMQPVGQCRVAVRNVIESTIDGINFREFFADLAVLISENKEIQTKFDRQVLESELFRNYNVTKLSFLCKAIADQVRESGEERAKRKFYQNLKVVLPEISQLSSRKQEILIKTMFKRIRGAGVVFV
jgi:hypothetical protein